MRLAILDDYQHAAMRFADWSTVSEHCAIDVIDRPLGTVEEAVATLASYEILCTMRERTEFPRALIEQLPRLKLITITGDQHRTLDMAAASERGILVCSSRGRGGGDQATPELAWGLILSLARHIPAEAARMRHGGWQNTVGSVLAGKTLGILGLGRVGSRIAHYGRAFDMDVVSWSPNLTAERAAAAGATLVGKEALFRDSDVLSLHLVLSETTRGIVDRRLLELMKPTALLVNTARAPLVDEVALLDILRTERIAGAALDVFDAEPLADDHPLRALDNVVLTPHLGYVVEETFTAFYEATVENVEAFVGFNPIRVLNPEALRGPRA